MLSGNREDIQRAIKRITQNKHLKKMFIADKIGTIQVASDLDLIGQTLDMDHSDCQICHTSNQVRSQYPVIYKNPDG